MRLVIVIVALVALFIYLYKRAIVDFRSGYEEGLKIGNSLSKNKKTPQLGAHKEKLPN